MNQRKTDTEGKRSELDFERGDEREGRIGDPKPMREVREEFPGRREREAGSTGGETPDQHVTADDMAPETLLDSERSHTPRSMRGRAANDTSLSTAGEDAVGMGGGLDEAEEADVDPVGKREAERIRRTSQQHAADPNMVEPHEARERAQAQRQRSGRR